MISASDKEVWNAEYSRPIIPGSIRKDPSHVLLLFEKLLQIRDMKAALDVGCGNGRNSVYLASLGLGVEGIDFSTVALQAAKSLAKERGVADRTHFLEADVLDNLPYPSSSFDLCLDLYVFPHFIDERAKRHYVQELYRVTKQGGYAISAVFELRDEYYGSMATSKHEPIIVRDTGNKVVKELYSEQSFRSRYSPPFGTKYFTEFEFKDSVQGKEYRRRILTMALQKTGS